MKKIYILLLIFFVAVQGFAQQASIMATDGTATLINNPQNIDYVFLFRDLNNATLTTTDNNPVWYKMQGAEEVFHASGVDYLYPENNTGYILRTDEGNTTFWVLDYSRYMPQFTDLQVDMETDDRCQETVLLLNGEIPEMTYTDKFGIEHAITRSAEVRYMSLAWNDEEQIWQDSVAVEHHPLAKSYKVGAPLQNTSFTITYDQYAALLGLQPDSIQSELYEAVAVAAHPTTVTTIRGTEAENQMCNEVERPVDAKQLSGSADMDILFKANGTPNVRYYRWELRKGDDLMVTRTDEQHRYTFNVYGGYRALLWVSSDYCTTDSTEIRINVSTSLLRVPNVFTPNGDLKNDEFRVVYRSINEFHCWVYNRWGKKVYEWTDPAKGWDGTINGRPAAESAYFYVIRAKGADGVEYKLKGDINLIRGK